MTDKITREEALEIYTEQMQKKLHEALDSTLTLCGQIDRIEHLLGAQQAATIGNALAAARDPRVVMVIDGKIYPLNTVHMDIIDPIFRALEEIVNLGRHEIAIMEGGDDSVF